MDVVLLKEVDRLGKEGSVVRVKPGFARNYLVPRGLAALANPTMLKAVEDRRRQLQLKQERIRKQTEQLKQRLESRSWTVKLTLGEGEQAFGSITVQTILEALANEGIALEKSAIKLEQPIKALGIYDVPVRLHPDLTATLKLWVVKA
ncbi:MAG: 50S ribosomal protein L9 [Candidatus Omnitrophica bacterium]|nr:50S ribosomal protein L9 [Candidatus Omnitrophota bacterium]